MQADILERSLVHAHGSGRADVVQVGGIDPAADGNRGSMDKHSHAREELVVAVFGDTGSLVAERWVARKDRSEANAPSERAEANARLVRAVERM